MNPDKDYLSDIMDEDNFGYTLASPLIRLGAVLLDGLITHLPLYLIFGEDSAFFSDQIYDLTSIISQAAYAALLGAVFYSLWSGNLGHRILGLKVISAVDGSDQKSAGMGVLREVLKSLLGLFILPSLWLLWDPKKQNLYDKIAKTLVVINNKS